MDVEIFSNISKMKTLSKTHTKYTRIPVQEVLSVEVNFTLFRVLWLNFKSNVSMAGLTSSVETYRIIRYTFQPQLIAETFSRWCPVLPGSDQLIVSELLLPMTSVSKSLTSERSPYDPQMLVQQREAEMMYLQRQCIWLVHLFYHRDHYGRLEQCVISPRTCNSASTKR